MAMELRPVGFWAKVAPDGRLDEPRLPRPQDCVDPAWQLTCAGRATAAYISRAGCLESYELAYATCRFVGCTAPARELGCATMTDGVWLWPEGLLHYLRAHAVRPPEGFVQHLCAAAAKDWGHLPPCVDCGLAACPARVTWPLRHHLQWDEAARAPIPMPRGTAAYLARVSTLRDVVR